MDRSTYIYIYIYVCVCEYMHMIYTYPPTPLGVSRRVVSLLPLCPLLLSSPRCFQVLPWYPLVTRGNPGDSWNVYFLETKSPCGVAPNIEEGLRIHPNKINSFLQKSGKVGFPQKVRF